MKIDVGGQSVLVVGGTSGINRGIAMAFAAQGCRVAVISRSQAKVDDTLAELHSGGCPMALGGAADVRDYEQLSAVVSSLAEQLDGFNTVISGAAGNFPALANDMSPNGFKSVVDIDLIGSFHVAKAVFPLIHKPGGALIHISAPQAQTAMAGQVHVCAAKAGVDMLTRTLALEWGGDGIRVNSVVPGPISGTEGERRLTPTPEMQEACRQSVPLKRLGTKEDVANLCLFLASPLASYVSGAVIPVDGGWSNGGFAAAGAALEPLLRNQGDGP